MGRTEYGADQIVDGALVEEIELLSDGTDSMCGPYSISAVDGSTKKVTVSSGSFTDDRVCLCDELVISGGTANDGTYTVDSVIDDNNVVVAEAINTAGAGGNCEIFFPPGAEKTGAEDPGAAYTHSGTYQTVQDHIDDATAHSGGGGNVSYSVFRGSTTAGSDTLGINAWTSLTLLGAADFSSGTPFSRSGNQLTPAFTGKYSAFVNLCMTAQSVGKILFRVRNISTGTTVGVLSPNESLVAYPAKPVMFHGEFGVTNVAHVHEVQYYISAASGTGSVTNTTVGGETAPRWEIVLDLKGS
jgi:hypothetical protein